MTIRIAVFGSFYRGFYVLDELLHGPHRHHFEVVGVATDDPAQSFVNAAGRVWRYPHRPEEETMVAVHAARHGIPVYQGRVRGDAFYAMYEQVWRPQLGLAATFGQRIDARVHQWPAQGFFNLHPCVADRWPSRFAGPNPFQALIDAGCDHARVALHRVDDAFDAGELIAYSPRFAIPPGASVVDLHKISALAAAQFAVARLLQRAQAGKAP